MEPRYDFQTSDSSSRIKEIQTIYTYIYKIFTNVLNHTILVFFFFFLLLPLAGSLLSVLGIPGALPSNPTIIHTKQLNDILSYFSLCLCNHIKIHKVIHNGFFSLIRFNGALLSSIITPHIAFYYNDCVNLFKSPSSGLIHCP